MNSGSVKKSVLIDAELEKVWTKVSKITKLDWLQGQKSTKYLDDKKSGVGSKRLISFKDGSNVEEHVVGWKPKEYFFESHYIFGRVNFRKRIRKFPLNYSNDLFFSTINHDLKMWI